MYILARPFSLLPLAALLSSHDENTCPLQLSSIKFFLPALQHVIQVPGRSRVRMQRLLLVDVQFQSRQPPHYCHHPHVT